MPVDVPRYVDGQPATPLTISDEDARERQIGDAMDTRIATLANTLASLPATLTAAQTRAVIRLLLVTVLGILRLLRRRFDAVED